MFCCRKIPQAEYFIKKRSLFAAHFWKLQYLLDSDESFMVEVIIMVGPSFKSFTSSTSPHWGTSFQHMNIGGMPSNYIQIMGERKTLIFPSGFQQNPGAGVCVCVCVCGVCKHMGTCSHNLLNWSQMRCKKYSR
jgi:hypothetical protein